MPLEFLATESGFAGGMGGASNAACTDEPHYVLFGKDGDGVYFEYDDQSHGEVDQVVRIFVHPGQVVFELRDSNTITVRRQTDEGAWNEFLAGIRHTFPPTILAGA